MLRHIDWGVKNRPIAMNGLLSVTTSLFWKICFSLRASYKGLIWCTNHPNVHRLLDFLQALEFYLRVLFFPVNVFKRENNGKTFFITAALKLIKKDKNVINTTSLRSANNKSRSFYSRKQNEGEPQIMTKFTHFFEKAIFLNIL